MGQGVGNQEEAELVRQARERAQPEAEQAFAALVRRWQVPLFRYVRGFRLPSYAEASSFLALLAGALVALALAAALRRPLEGREAR